MAKALINHRMHDFRAGVSMINAYIQDDAGSLELNDLRRSIGYFRDHLSEFIQEVNKLAAELGTIEQAG